MFNALAQIQRMDPDSTPMPEMIHQQLSTYIDQGVRAATRMGFSQHDVDDMRYALVALTDETVLQKGGAAARLLAAAAAAAALLRRERGRRSVLPSPRERCGAIRRASTSCACTTCACCSAFTGKYRVRGGQLELADIIERVREDLARAKVVPSELALSPHGPRPYEAIADARRNMLLVWLVGGGGGGLRAALHRGCKLSLIDACADAWSSA